MRKYCSLPCFLIATQAPRHAAFVSNSHSVRGQPRFSSKCHPFPSSSTDTHNEEITKNVNDIPAEKEALSYGWSDEEFQEWFTVELSKHPLMKHYPVILELAPKAVTSWRKRYRGNPNLWRRIFTHDRVIKELIEAAPILDAVIQIVHNSNDCSDPFTILDLCSGRGYLGMLLSEILPKDKVDKIVLIDKAWPMCNAELKPHHINWEHIYGNRTLLSEDGEEIRNAGTYFETWPIHLHTSKQDLKQPCNRRQIKKVIFDRVSGPVLILAVHLCGTLSLRAVDMFNDHFNVQFLALKPCCLPPMVHANRDDVFKIGKHKFEASEVCAVGRFRGKRWYGPPRWHLEGRFNKWADHLFAGVDLGEIEFEGGGDDKQYGIKNQTVIRDIQGNKVKLRELVQTDGGYQNTYIFAERSPLTEAVWDRINNKIGSEGV